MNENTNWHYLSEALSGKKEAILYIIKKFILPVCEGALNLYVALRETGVTSDKLADDFWSYLKDWTPLRSFAGGFTLRTYIAVVLSKFLMRNNEYKRAILKQCVQEEALKNLTLEVLLEKILNSDSEADLTLEEQRVIRLLCVARFSLQGINGALNMDVYEVRKLRDSAIKKIEDHLKHLGLWQV